MGTLNLPLVANLIQLSLMNIGYIAFGDHGDTHLQANFSILSIFAAADCAVTINVITNRPVYYSQLSTLIKIIEIDEQTLADWRGPHDYIYRIKIKAIEKINQLYPQQPVLLLDADTFMYRKISELNARMNCKTAFMHKREGKLSQMRWKAQKLMWKAMRNKTYAGVTILKKHAMWNAGVVLLPGPKNDITIALALQLCDEMLHSGAPVWLVEQFASSVAVSENFNLAEASEWICHYWGHKPAWNEYLRHFFATCHVEKLSILDQIERFKEFDVTSIPVSVRRNKGYQKIMEFAEKLFPLRHVQYLKTKPISQIHGPLIHPRISNS
jgi:hypothetical protein